VIHSTGRAAQVLRPLLAACAFLARAPFVGRMQFSADELVRGAVAFPAVGALIGALVGVAAVVQVELGMPVLLAAAGAVVVDVVVTGALHLDGLADSADGLAGRNPEHSLEVMRDHGVGVYGASAVVLDLLVKVAAIAALPASDAVVILVAVYAVSRAAPLPLSAALSYAGSNGTGRVFVQGMRWDFATAGTGIAAALAFLAVGTMAVAMLGGLLVVAVAVGFSAGRRLAGVTGDVLGAAVELTTLVGLVAAVAWTM
jgi:adenosylcobinamide-GDP ribazoletransferase